MRKHLLALHVSLLVLLFASVLQAQAIKVDWKDKEVVTVLAEMRTVFLNTPEKYEIPNKSLCVVDNAK